MPFRPFALQRKMVSTIFTVGMLAAGTGCDDNKQMKGEMAALKEQVQTLLDEETHIEDDMKKAVTGYAAISSSNAIRKSGMTLQQKRDTASAEIATLKKERDKLQAEVDAINKAAAAYRQKYL